MVQKETWILISTTVTSGCTSFEKKVSGSKPYFLAHPKVMEIFWQLPSPSSDDVVSFIVNFNFNMVLLNNINVQPPQEIKQ